MCIHISKTGTCEALKTKQCAGCKFALTAERQAEKLATKYERFRNLPERQQLKIAETYYEGAMPWQT